jgi:hypothetical protein
VAPVVVAEGAGGWGRVRAGLDELLMGSFAVAFPLGDLARFFRLLVESEDEEEESCDEGEYEGEVPGEVGPAGHLTGERRFGLGSTALPRLGGVFLSGLRDFFDIASKSLSNSRIESRGNFGIL